MCNFIMSHEKQLTPDAGEYSKRESDSRAIDGKEESYVLEMSSLYTRINPMTQTCRRAEV